MTTARWPTELYADDGEGPARDPTPRDRRHIKGPHYLEVEAANAGPIEARLDYRVVVCSRVQADGTKCGREFTATTTRRYCPECRAATKAAYKRTLRARWRAEGRKVT